MALGNAPALRPIKQPGKEKAVFIDKDGTLIHDVPYNVDPRRVRLAAHAGRALRRIGEAGYKLIIVSNQSGIARSFFAGQDLGPINERIQTLLAPYEVEIDAFYYCPHGPGDRCECRKPRPGMILQAARDHGIKPQNSWVIGGIFYYVGTGKRGGCRTNPPGNRKEKGGVKGEERETPPNGEGWDTG